jgi:hypothetical protein
MWFTRVVLILAGLAMLSGSCQAADDRKLCASNGIGADRVIAACRRVVAANPGDLGAVLGSCFGRRANMARPSRS